MLSSGFYAALPTPFAGASLEIAPGVLGDLVVEICASGLTGLYVGGSTGEAFLMSLEERERILRVTAEAAAKDCILIAQIGDPNPAVSSYLARIAKQIGYHAISAVPPFYYSYSVEEIKAHYRWLAQQTDLPFIVYNFPELSGVRWSPDDLAALVDLPNIVGVKNTCSDLYAFEKLRDLRPGALLFYGFDQTLLSGLGLGADGGIGSTYNVQASRILSIASAYRSGRIDEARALQTEANRVIDAMISVGVFRALKYLLGLQGFAMGPCRPPFRPITAEECQLLDAVAEKYLSSPQKLKTAARGG